MLAVIFLARASTTTTSQEIKNLLATSSSLSSAITMSNKEEALQEQRVASTHETISTSTGKTAAAAIVLKPKRKYTRKAADIDAPAAKKPRQKKEYKSVLCSTTDLLESFATAAPDQTDIADDAQESLVLQRYPNLKNISSQFYNPQRSRNLYDTRSSEPFKISRSKLEMFLGCQFHFYMDRSQGVGVPPGYPFNLNSNVDAGAKTYFDSFRTTQTVPPLYKKDKDGNKVAIDAVPFAHPLLEDWRNSLYKGLQYKVPGTNIILQGGIDDIFVDRATGELILVDYKSTSKKSEVSLDADWQDGYKRQIEIYQYLARKVLQQEGYTVSNTSYFIYYNGKDIETSGESFKMPFDVTVLEYQGDDSWVEQAAQAAYTCLQSDEIPKLSPACDHCKYLDSLQLALSKKKSTK